MMRRYLLGLLFPSLAFASVVTQHVDEKELYFGEAYYYASQNNYVDAIVRQDIARLRFYGPGKVSPLHIQPGSTRFDLGDFESSYRMHQRAESVFKAIVEGNADQSVRNEALFRLAGVFMQQGEVENARSAIEKISGRIPEDIRDDELYLRSQIYMANGDFAGAVRSLQKLQNANNYTGFAAYNLGVALIKIGQEKPGLDMLDKAGKISGEDEVILSIKDKANLALGSRLITAQKPAMAKQYLERVRLTGPYSNKALLGLGWADVALGRYDSALAPWLVLVKRNVTDKSVQESMLGVPYAYAQLNLPGKAARFYGKALEEFERESTRLDASIRSVSAGELLKELLLEYPMGDVNLNDKSKPVSEISGDDYLFEMRVSRDFQELLINYRDLDDLAKRLASWEEDPGSLVSLRPSTNRSYQGYENQIRQLKKRVHDTRQKVGDLRAGYGKLLEAMAINELNLRLRHLQEFQAMARLGLADSYERASKMQAAPSGVK